MATLQEITITLPAIDEQVLTDLDQTTTLASHTGVEALRLIREKYAKLARQNGQIRIAHVKRGNQNWSEEEEHYLARDGRRVKAIKVYDGFEQVNSEEFRGNNTGNRLYLTELGEWLRIERDGRWSSWPGEGSWWSCDCDVVECDPRKARIEVRTDEQVEAEYPLDAILSGLAESLKVMQTKIPVRMVQVQRRLQLATGLIEALQSA